MVLNLSIWSYLLLEPMPLLPSQRKRQATPFPTGPSSSCLPAARFAGQQEQTSPEDQPEKQEQSIDPASTRSCLHGFWTEEGQSALQWDVRADRLRLVEERYLIVGDVRFGMYAKVHLVVDGEGAMP
jgi:hypothetical protein